MRRTVMAAALGLAVAGLVAASLFTSEAARPSSRPPNQQLDKVLMFGIPFLRVADVAPATMPNLAKLASTGATAVMNVRTGDHTPSAEAAYASIGAGDRMKSPGLPTAVYDVGEPYEGTTAGQAQDRMTGHSAAAAAVIPSLPSRTGERGSEGHGRLGAVAAALEARGYRSAVVSNADERLLSGQLVRQAPAALAAADPEGRVAAGTVSSALLEDQPAAPFGLRIDSNRFVAACEAALRSAAFVVADPGETLRAAGYAADQTPAQAETARRAALARTDRLLGQLASRLPRHTLLLVAGVTPAGSAWTLAPLVASGDGVPRGKIVSPSTHHAGLVTLTDLAPTVLRVAGVPKPPEMVGAALRYQPGNPSLAGGRRLDEIVSTRSAVQSPLGAVFIAAQAAVYGIAALLLWWRRGLRGVAGMLEIGALSCAAWPLATFWLRIWEPLGVHGASVFVLSWVAAVALAAAVWRLRAHPLDPLLAICALTITTIVIDLATGSHLQLGSFFGYGPNTATRYSGIGNAAFAILGGATVVCCTALVDRSPRRREAWLLAAAVAVVVVLADGASWMGADVGGLLSLVPVFALMLWALSRRPLRRRTVAVSLLATAAALGTMVAVEAFRPPDQRTHIGRFFLGAGKGNAALVETTLRHKLQMNMAGSTNAWGLVVLVLACLGIYVLVVAKGWRSLLPPGSARRTGVVAGLALSIVGWLLNDSGLIVTALVLVYLSPTLLLLATRRHAGSGDGPLRGYLAQPASPDPAGGR